ncbi:MAG: MerR family transcriptional regulator [Desulfobacterales bacterium]
MMIPATLLEQAAFIINDCLEDIMKISTVVKRTGVPKETIHFYIREGLVRKPHKSKINIADYNENHVKQIRFIKELRDNYFFPIPLIKKIMRKVKKQPSADRAFFELHSTYFRPADRLLTKEIVGRDAFHETTGLGRKWIIKAEEWGLIEPLEYAGQPVYSLDDVAIAKLMVDMDRIGFGPKDGHDPEDLRYIADFVKEFVVNSFKKYYQTNLEKLSATDFNQKRDQFHEVISLFFYHLYRKFARQAIHILLESEENDKMT